jgi:hypothetical protein
MALVEVRGGKRIWEDTGSAEPFWGSSVALSPDGAKILLVEMESGAATVIDHISRRTTRLEGQVQHGFIGPNGRVATVGPDGISLHAIEHGSDRRTRLTVDGPLFPFFASFSPDAKRLFTARGPRLEVWDEDGRAVDHIDLTPAQDAVTCLAIAPDGQSFVLGTARGSALVFRRNDSEPRPPR